MIEFIIPLNLPVRAVEVTATTEGPSEKLLQEMNRWTTYHQYKLPAGQGLTNPHQASNAAHSPADKWHMPTPAEIEEEMNAIRAQKALFTNAADELRKTSRLVEQRLEGMLREFQEATVELAQAIAAKLIFEEVDQNRFPIANLVHEVISRLDTSVNAVIRLHPDDLALIEESPKINGSNPEASVKFVGDATVARGDCKAKAGEISVVYELRRQIEEIRRQLLSTVGGHAAA